MVYSAAVRLLKNEIFGQTSRVCRPYGQSFQLVQERRYFQCYIINQMGRKIKTTSSIGMSQPSNRRRQVANAQSAGNTTLSRSVLKEPIFEEDDVDTPKQEAQKQEKIVAEQLSPPPNEQEICCSVPLRPKRSSKRRPLMQISSSPEEEEEEESFKPARSKRRSQRVTAQRVKLEENEEDYRQISFEDPASECFQETDHSTPSTILFSREFQQISQSDFRIYADSISRSRVYSLMLVNKCGNIIYSDKLGHQFFQGSLNNFKTMRIQNLLVQTFKSQFLSELRSVSKFDKDTIFNWIIYSKNTKRRYSKVPFNNRNTNDIFFRFLKCLTLRIRPVQIKGLDPSTVDGLWNIDHLSKNGQCFMLEARLCSRKPTIPYEILAKDPVLEKYIKANSQKAEIWAKTKKYSEQQLEQRNKDSDIFIQPLGDSNIFYDQIEQEEEVELRQCEEGQEEKNQFNVMEAQMKEEVIEADVFDGLDYEQMEEVLPAVSFQKPTDVKHDQVGLIGKMYLQDL